MLAIQAIMHEQYDNRTLQNDIALLKLPNPVTLTGIGQLLSNVLAYGCAAFKK